MRKVAAFILSGIFIFSIVLSINTKAEDLVNAKSAILVEMGSGKPLYEYNADEELPPASVTKIMTMLLIMEAIERGEIGYDTVVTASERAKSMGGSTIFLDSGEEMSVNDLLKGIAVASGNDACVAMAEKLSGSVEAFVDVMNNRAAEMGMTHTHFVTCNGLDDENHYTTARDISIMSRELAKHKDIFKYTTIWMDSLRGGAFTLANTNKLIRYYSGANGLKTGSTSKAGNCISATAERDGMTLCAVILGSPTSKERFASASNLLNYGFENFASQGFEKGEVVGEVLVKKGDEASVRAVLQEGCNAVVEKAKKNDLQKQTVFKESVEAPIAQGDVLGTITLSLDGETIATANIVAEKNIDRVNIGGMYLNILHQWTTLQ